jgi:hypothetical protein
MNRPLEGNHLDGNSLAGPLSAIFRFDPTVAVGQCENCGDVRPLGASMVYSSDMGHVVRCATCDNVQLIFVQTPGSAVVSTCGLTWLRIPTTVDSGTR